MPDFEVITPREKRRIKLRQVAQTFNDENHVKNGKKFTAKVLGDRLHIFATPEQ